MANDTLNTYVAGERAKGVTDDAIRTELLAKGWDARTVGEVLPAHAVPAPAIGMPIEAIAWYTIAAGFALFLVSSALLWSQGAGRDLENQIVFAAFSITHIVNIAAAIMLFLMLWRFSRAAFVRVIVALAALLVVAFATLSLLHFVSLATGAPFFDEFQRFVLHDDYMPLFIYFLLLPLQAVTFLLLLITLFVVRWIRKRRAIPVTVGPLAQVLAVFFVMALLALGDLYLVLDGGHF